MRNEPRSATSFYALLLTGLMATVLVAHLAISAHVTKPHTHTGVWRTLAVEVVPYTQISRENCWKGLSEGDAQRALTAPLLRNQGMVTAKVTMTPKGCVVEAQRYELVH